LRTRWLAGTSVAQVGAMQKNPAHDSGIIFPNVLGSAKSVVAARRPNQAGYLILVASREVIA